MKKKFGFIWKLLVILALIAAPLTYSSVLHTSKTTSGKTFVTIDAVGAVSGADYTYTNPHADIAFALALSALPATGGTLDVLSTGAVQFASAITVTKANVVINCSGVGTAFTAGGVNAPFIAGANGLTFENCKFDVAPNMGATTGWLWVNVAVGTTLYTERSPNSSLVDNTYTGNVTGNITGSAGTAGTATNQSGGTINATSGTVTTLNATTLNAPTGRTASYVIAASNSSALDKSQADYISTDWGATVNSIIVSALTAGYTGCNINTSAGSYTWTTPINATQGGSTIGSLNFTGAGSGFQAGYQCVASLGGTIIKLSNGLSGLTMIHNSTGAEFYTGMSISRIMFDGNNETGCNFLDFAWFNLNAPGTCGLFNVVITHFPGSALFESVSQPGFNQPHMDFCQIQGCGIGIGDNTQLTDLVFPCFIDNTYIWGCINAFKVRTIRQATINIGTFANTGIAMIATDVDNSQITLNSKQDADVWLHTGTVWCSKITITAVDCGMVTANNNIFSFAGILSSYIELHTNNSAQAASTYTTTLVNFTGNCLASTVAVYLYEGGTNSSLLSGIYLPGIGGCTNFNLIGNMTNSNGRTGWGTPGGGLAICTSQYRQNPIINVNGYNPVGKITNFIDAQSDLSPNGVSATIPASTDMLVIISPVILTWSSTAPIIIKDPSGTQINPSETSIIMRLIPVGYSVNVGSGTVTVTSTAFQ